MKITCPFTYPNGKKCNGHIIEIRQPNSEVVWDFDEDERWNSQIIQVNSPFHLFCSLEGYHSKNSGEVNQKLKFKYKELPSEIQIVIQSQYYPPPDVTVKS